jgi:hypothetical protein
MDHPHDLPTGRSHACVGTSAVYLLTYGIKAGDEEPPPPPPDAASTSRHPPPLLGVFSCLESALAALEQSCMYSYGDVGYSFVVKSVEKDRLMAHPVTLVSWTRAPDTEQNHRRGIAIGSYELHRGGLGATLLHLT